MHGLSYGFSCGSGQKRRGCGLGLWILDPPRAGRGKGIFCPTRPRCLPVFFARRGLAACLYYFDLPERTRLERLQARDKAIRDGKVKDSYRMDGGIREILDARFEPPLPSEVDVWMMS